MFRAFLSVSLLTLLSRLTGFARDILMAQILGAGALMDAFTIAFRLPNHFRAIFAEGAFNTAFVPVYTRLRDEGGVALADLFLGRMTTLVVLSQGLILVGVLGFPQVVIAWVTPGLEAKPQVYELASVLLRLTFPYLSCITLVVLWGGVLNAEKRFAAAAFAPVLLNLAMISTLVLHGLFTTPAHAAAFGVLIAGGLEAAFLGGAVRRAGLFSRPSWLSWRVMRQDETFSRFFRAFLPALVGSAGVQLAMLADTFLVAFLPTGGASALYYADRLYQLPIGIIGLALGTVLLPEMTKLITQSREGEAFRAQNRALALTFLLSAPFCLGFLLLPDLLVAVFFERGAFDVAAREATARVLMAYAIGLPALLSLRAVLASFYARSDTKTPLIASIAGIVVNVILKFLFWQSWGVMGLALATSCGAWVNIVLLYILALRAKKTAPDGQLFKVFALVGVLCVLAGLGIGYLKPSLAVFGFYTAFFLWLLLGGVFYGGGLVFGFYVLRISWSLK